VIASKSSGGVVVPRPQDPRNGHYLAAGVAGGRTITAVLRIFLLVLLLAATALASVPTFPQLTGRVVDDANVLSPATRSELIGMLQRHEQATGEQVVVVTLPSLQGYSIEDFGYQLGRYWGIGQKDKNTGALLIVAPKEHKVRIEVGYGLEGKLTDAQSSVIINRDIVPQFRRGDFNAGVLAGTATLLKVLGGDTTTGTAATADAEPATDSGVPANTWANSPWVVPAFFALWLIVMLVIVALRNRRNPNVVRRVGRSDSFSDGGSSSGSGFLDDDDSFSGGGGSFGGGGASGSW